MKALCPIYFTGASESQVFQQEREGLPLSLALAARLRTSTQGEVFICSNDREVLAKAELLGMQGIWLPEKMDGYASRGLWPQGRICLAHLREYGLVQDQEDCLLANFRAIGITQATVQRAAARYFQSRPVPLISVAYPEDHPVQMMVSYRITHFDIYACRDPNCRCGDRADLAGDFNLLQASGMLSEPEMSHPYYFEWVSHGIFQRPGIYIAVPLGTEGLQMIPADRLASHSGYLDPRRPGFYSFESPTTARRIAPRDFWRPRADLKLAALPIFSDPGESPIIVIEERPGSPYQVYIRSDFMEQRGLIVCWPFRNGAPRLDGSITVDLGEWQPGEQGSQALGGGKFIGPVGSVDGEYQGFILTVLSESDAAENDIVLPMQMRGCPWRYDREDGGFRDAQNGEVIYGRQAFPRLYELVDSLIICRAADVDGLEEYLARGQVNPFALQGAEVLQVKTNFDVLRCSTLADEDAKLFAGMPYITEIVAPAQTSRTSCGR